MSVKKEGTTDSKNHFCKLLCDAVEERGSRRESKQWVENCANAPNLLLVSLVVLSEFISLAVLSEFISLTLFHGDVQMMFFFSEAEPQGLDGLGY